MNTIWWVLENWWLLAVLAAIGAGWWFAGWRGALAIATLGVGWLGYRQGRADIERKYARERYEAQRARKESDDEIAKLEPDAVDEHLDKWLRD